MARTVEIIGHRGARGLFPENTLEGFRAAQNMGLHAFELDVGMTRDGVVVVSHDLALNPAITRDETGQWLDGSGPLLHSLTFDEIQRYDVGRIRPGTPYRLLHRKQAAHDGARIPTLDAVLKLSSHATFIIELKTDPRRKDGTSAPEAMADAVLDIIDRTGSADRITLESFDWRGPRYVRRIRPQIQLAWLTWAETTRDAALWWDRSFEGCSVPAMVAREGGGTWAPAHETLKRAEVEEAHALGLKVVPWTVNRKSAIRRLIFWAVDGIITDRPDTAFAEAGFQSLAR